jgi:hypothetical protein
MRRGNRMAQRSNLSSRASSTCHDRTVTPLDSFPVPLLSAAISSIAAGFQYVERFLYVDLERPALFIGFAVFNMNHNESPRKFECLMEKEAEHAHERATGLEAFSPHLVDRAREPTRRQSTTSLQDCSDNALSVKSNSDHATTRS